MEADTDHRGEVSPPKKPTCPPSSDVAIAKEDSNGNLRHICVVYMILNIINPHGAW